ncbi:hypothetical protein [Azotobacter chroococcum]|uniref:hypothetical protein n=1 Tax=Azotobacter chroococcum TaxID=353 RepID=UPI0010AEE7A8|nr:hypothetical protein [Azotobacter chroococcum]TKD37244.1 hypothetical protein FCG41_15380 [Azotobacter chroococcum]
MKPVPLGESSIERADRLQRILGVVSLVAAVATTLIAGGITFLKSDQATITFIPSYPPVVKSLQAAEIEVSKLREQITTLRSETAKITQIPDEAKLGVRLGELNQLVKSLDERLQKLETAILSNPAKALEIPLLQRDLENLRQSQQANLTAVKEGVDRLYDINKWLLGAMAISIITLALSNFLRSRPTEVNQ